MGGQLDELLIGFSGRPLPCVLTIVALLYMYFVKCTVTNKYINMID